MSRSYELTIGLMPTILAKLVILTIFFPDMGSTPSLAFCLVVELLLG